MTLAAALIWLLILPGIGAALLRPRGLGFGYLLLSSGILGSFVAGVAFLTLSQLGLFTTPNVLGLAALFALMGALGWWHIFGLKEPSLRTSIRTGWSSLDTWDRRWFWLIAFCLLILCLDALAPPRGADAMRYHLAQLEDMVRNQGFVFRPYYHYNFPLYYSYLTAPVYFVAGGGGAEVFNFLMAIVVAGLTFGLGRAAGLRRPLVPVLGFLLTPGIVWVATEFRNDIGTMVFGLGGILLLHGYSRVRRTSFLTLAFLSLGFALGIKYQSVLFLPWYLYLLWVAFGRRLGASQLRWLVVLGCITVLVPAPFFVRNYLNTGVPDWPMHLDLFGAQRDFVYEMVARYNRGLIGGRSFEALFSSLKGFVTSGLTLPTMWLFSLLGIYVLLRRGRDRTGLYLVFGIVSQFVLWWIIQPSLYVRFVNFFIPQLMVAAVVGFEMLTGAWLRRSALILGAATAALGVVVLGAYSQSPIRYLLGGDLERYHNFTWFHDEYMWMDQSLPEDAHVLVIALSGHTYYMPREYLRADPTYSGLMDWRELDAEGLYDEMGRRGLDYVFYHNREWDDSVGGADLSRVMEEFVGRADVKVLWTRQIELGTSRIRGRTMDAEVWMLERIPPLEPSSSEMQSSGGLPKAR